MMNSFPSSQEASGERTHLLPLSESSRTDLDVLRSRESNNYELMRARRLLYLSHLFNQFSENAWQFCLVLFLAAFSNFKSLLLICTYGIVSGLCVCYFGSTTGRFIDGSNRLLVARRFIGAENFAVLLATSFCYILLSRQRGDPLSDKNDTRWPSSQGVPNDPVSILLLIGIHILGAAAKILDSGFVIAIERDWIVVMSRFLVFESQSSDEVSQRQKKWLSQTNVAMKQIDLSCKVAAPAFAGFFVALLDDGSDPHHGSDLRGAALFVGVFNALALVVEYFCTAKIYQKIPDLAIKSIYTESSIKSDARHEKEQEKKSNGLMIYLKQPVAFAGIGLSLLYLNVLTFGGIMTAYLVWRGMTMEAIGIWRGVSSAAGLSGTFVYHLLSTRISLVDSGMCSILFQFSCLSLSYASLYVEDYITSLGMLISGVCASRVGLWVFDISVTQLMQEHIPEGVRGLVGGVQQSLNAFFLLFAFALGIIIPDPQYFHIYVSAGYASVGIAVLCYGAGVYAKRKELVSLA